MSEYRDEVEKAIGYAEPDTQRFLAQYIELGVALGLQAAAHYVGAHGRSAGCTPYEMGALILHLDPAAVLRKEKP